MSGWSNARRFTIISTECVNGNVKGMSDRIELENET